MASAMQTEARAGRVYENPFTAEQFWTIFIRMNTVAPANQSPAGLVSPLLKKIQQMGLELPLDLERLAVLRGCDYYQRKLPPRVPPLTAVPLSNAELALALIIPALSPTPREIRLAAALLGAPDVRAGEVMALAIQEHCAPIVRYIAECGQRYEPRNSFWSELTNNLPETSTTEASLPHPTRFVEMTGIDRQKVGTFTRWIRPRLAAAA
jgi:hypothetical protein